MQNKTRHHFAGCTLVVATILFATGCSGSSIAENAGQKAQATGWRFEFPRGFPTTDELQKYLGRESLGEQVNVQARDRLVFAQTFPYSGVQASHLFVYRKSDTDLTLFCFFYVATQAEVELKAVENGFVEIRAEGKLVATLPQSAGS